MPVPQGSRGQVNIIAAAQSSLGSMGDIYFIVIVLVFVLAAMNVCIATLRGFVWSQGAAHAWLLLLASGILIADFQFVHIPPMQTGGELRSGSALLFGMHPSIVWSTSLSLLSRLSNEISVLDIRAAFTADNIILMSTGETWVIATFLFLSYVSLVLVGGSVSRHPAHEIKSKSCRTCVILGGFSVVYWGYLGLCGVGWALNRDALLSAVSGGRSALSEWQAAAARNGSDAAIAPDWDQRGSVPLLWTGSDG